MSTVGAYEAKTNLARLLKEVEAGGTVTITRHGKPIARLVAPRAEVSLSEDLVAAFAEARGGCRLEAPVKGIIAEGRR